MSEPGRVPLPFAVIAALGLMALGGIGLLVTWRLGAHDEPTHAAPSESEVPPAFGEYVQVDQLPEAKTKVAPSYPDLAREANLEGTVVVQALVGKDGTVKDTKIVKSIPKLDEAAETAVRQWTFEPARSNNRPVAIWVAVPVRFSLQ